ncbi:uncharacterized protein LOC111915517 [Lactuca sativa]|uniref:uncharacterized protein LOC111915517 n=1 Tax=Lactuca sativa TaxID=4236 RepID=UPI000CD8FEB6|nr:uncharacterized protein LOC111915517 [Lactuca sativa]
MAMVLRYVDRLGIVKERFIGVVHVLDTSSLTLKSAIDRYHFFQQHYRSGQGYDGTSTMSGAFNGLKYLILNENSSAYYIHCFAHQLQLVVVAVAKKYDDVDEFFEQLGLVVTVVCGSCKRKNMIREMQKERVATEIGIGETKTGRRLNQKISLVRAGDTRWGSHFRTIVSLLNLFAEVVAVLKYVKEEGSTLSNRNQAKDMQIQEFRDRFSEVGTELMENMAALSPCDSFSSFDKVKS